MYMHLRMMKRSARIFMPGCRKVKQCLHAKTRFVYLKTNLARVLLPWTRHIVQFPQETRVKWLSQHMLESLADFFSLTRHVPTM